MLHRFLYAPALGGIFLMLACGGSAPETELPPSEKFNWGRQPIRFSPAPEDWRRESYGDGGYIGVWYVKSGSVGERILMATSSRFERRDRCAELQEMLSRCRELDWDSFGSLANKAQIDSWHPVNAQEKMLGEQVGDCLARARKAILDEHPSAVCDELALALEQAGRISFTLDDADEDDTVVFRGKGHSRADRFEDLGRASREVASETAIQRDYTFEHLGNLFLGREIFVMVNNRLFVAAFHGLEENLPLFERMVETISFPAAECQH